MRNAFAAAGALWEENGNSRFFGGAKLGTFSAVDADVGCGAVFGAVINAFFIDVAVAQGLLGLRWADLVRGAFERINIYVIGSRIALPCPRTIEVLRTARRMDDLWSFCDGNEGRVACKRRGLRCHHFKFIVGTIERLHDSRTVMVRVLDKYLTVIDAPHRSVTPKQFFGRVDLDRCWLCWLLCKI